MQKPRLGMTLIFKDGDSQGLAGVQGTVIDIWPRLRSGDYLVTLQLARPVKYGREVITQIDAFMSELAAPDRRQPVPPGYQVPRRPTWRAN